MACVGTLAIVHHDTKQPFHCKQVCMSKALLQVRNREQLVLKAAGCTASYYRQVASILLVTDITSSYGQEKRFSPGVEYYHCRERFLYPGFRRYRQILIAYMLTSRMHLCEMVWPSVRACVSE